MSGFTPIDLGTLPAPDVLQLVDFDTLLTEMKSKVVELMPELEPFLALESEPVTKLLQVCAYLRLQDRAEFNDGARACMLPHATGADLDNLATFWGVERLTVQEADDTVAPPILEIREDDTAFRRRINLSLEGHTTAGPAGAYLFWALSADGDVADATVISPAPGDVLVTVLSHQGDGTPSAQVLDAVINQLNADDVRPLTDQVSVQAPTIIPYTVEATLTLYPGPQAQSVADAASEALGSYIDARHRLGHDVTLSGLFGALHQEGVQNVEITSPVADIVVSETEVAYCSLDAVAIQVGGRDV